MKKICILTLVMGLNLAFALAQSAPTFPVKDLHITRQVLNNVSDKTLSEITIFNKGKETLPAAGWTIFFNSRPLKVEKDSEEKATIKPVNGDLFKLTPSAGFPKIAPGESVKIKVLSTEVKNKTDLSWGFYLVWDNAPAKGYNISLTNIHPAAEAEKREAALAANAFNLNKEIKDIPLNKLPKVFPTPTSYRETGGVFLLTPAVPIIADKAFQKEAALFATELAVVFGKRPLVKETGIAKAVILKKGSVNGAESYTLSVNPERILITAADAAGAFYGIQSLKTMFPPSSLKGIQKNITVTSVEVEDAPRFGFRGFMMEVARNFQSKKEVLKVLDVMSLYKMNVLHFHLNDDEGWRLEIPGLPELTTVGSQRGIQLAR